MSPTIFSKEKFRLKKKYQFTFQFFCRLPTPPKPMLASSLLDQQMSQYNANKLKLLEDYDKTHHALLSRYKKLQHMNLQVKRTIERLDILHEINTLLDTICHDSLILLDVHTHAIFAKTFPPTWFECRRGRIRWSDIVHIDPTLDPCPFTGDVVELSMLPRDEGYAPLRYKTLHVAPGYELLTLISQSVGRLNSDGYQSMCVYVVKPKRPVHLLEARVDRHIRYARDKRSIEKRRIQNTESKIK